jgi:hypothetical protein
MSEGINVFRGVRRVDWVLAGALTALGTWLMVEDVLIHDSAVAGFIAGGTMVHPMSSHSWAMVPLFALATVPVLWWRRNVIVVTGIALVVMVLHDLLFGWVTRCGAGLPLVFVLAYLGAVTLERREAWIPLVLSTLAAAAVLVVDSTTGFEAMVLALPVVLIVFGIGRAVRHRTAMSTQLKDRTRQLQRLRDERVALELSTDRVRLSQQLDGLLQERLGQLTAAADSGHDLDPNSARRLFESIENDSRATLDGMREIVGLLRGGDVALAPAPTVAHLDALLARHTRSDSRLTVAGDPRCLRRSSCRRTASWSTSSMSSPTSRSPASRSACASAMTPSRSGSTGPWRGPPTSRPPWLGRGSAPSSSADRSTSR